MSSNTSLQRVFTTLEHKEPDKVPLFLIVTMHGAKELGMSIKEYFSKASSVVKGQLLMHEKYRTDCVNTMFYLAVEVEAYGGEIIYYTDGPPNLLKPIIRKKEDIKRLTSPDVKESKPLEKVINAIGDLKDELQDSAPIIALVVSPFSIPVMQMGFDKYIELIYEDKELFTTLMEINQEFCINYSNAQLEAGATMICYVDPVSSPTIISRELYLETGFKIAKETISKINGPVGTHLASGRALPIIDDVAQTGALVLGASSLEDLSELKNACRNKITLLGNLNGNTMPNWTLEQTETIVKDAIAKAGPGGGFILADHHETPFQVPENVLLAISNAVEKWGNYPLEWVE